jgi:hypothetical protein
LQILPADGIRASHRQQMSTNMADLALGHVSRTA